MFVSWWRLQYRVNKQVEWWWRSALVLPWCRHWGKSCGRRHLELVQPRGPDNSSGQTQRGHWDSAPTRPPRLYTPAEHLYRCEACRNEDTESAAQRGGLWVAVADGAGGGGLGAQTNWKYGRSGPSSLILFSSSSECLVKGIFVKIKPNCLSSGDIALATTLISTCLSTDELLLSGMRVVENGPITWGQTYKNNIDSL